MKGHADWLSSFWAVVHRRPRIAANFLFPSHPKGYVTATEALGAFAMNASVAMTSRLRGDIQAASIYERIADDIYKRLPGYAKEVAEGLEGYDEEMIEPLMMKHGQIHEEGYGLRPWSARKR